MDGAKLGIGDGLFWNPSAPRMLVLALRFSAGAALSLSLAEAPMPLRFACHDEAPRDGGGLVLHPIKTSLGEIAGDFSKSVAAAFGDVH